MTCLGVIGLLNCPNHLAEAVYHLEELEEQLVQAFAQFNLLKEGLLWLVNRINRIIVVMPESAN